MVPLLQVQELRKFYKRRQVVSDLSFSLSGGEIVGLLGHNGAGKTTVFNAIMGLIGIDGGSLHLNSVDITRLATHKRAKLGLGYLAQEPSVFHDLTVAENLLCILQTLPLSKKVQKERLEQHLEEMQLTHLRDQKACMLSGGEKRRVEISRSLITEPQLLLLDEPFANVDPITIADLKNLLLGLKARGITLFITDHNARELLGLVDRGYLIANGTLLAEGTPQELLENPQARTGYFGADFVTA